MPTYAAETNEQTLTVLCPHCGDHITVTRSTIHPPRPTVMGRWWRRRTIRYLHAMRTLRLGIEIDTALLMHLIQCQSILDDDELSVVSELGKHERDAVWLWEAPGDPDATPTEWRWEEDEWFYSPEGANSWLPCGQDEPIVAYRGHFTERRA